MKAVIQRVSKASVTIDNKEKSAIKLGLLVFIGIENADTVEDIKWLSNKIVNLRIFDDENKIPLYVETPISVGYIKTKIKSYKGLKHKLTSKIQP